MLKQSEASAERQLNGSWLVAAIVHGYRVSMVYYGYTKRDAVRKFVTDVNTVTASVKVEGV